MNEGTHSYIEAMISRRKPGDISFPTDFRGRGTQAAIKKALSRLAKEGRIRRLAHGIYYIPKIDPVLGELRPDVDDVVKMIARKEHIRVRPTGAAALHSLGLTTQVPTKRVYLTDGSSRRFTLGKMQVHFKATSPKKLSTRGNISSLVIQAIEEIGAEHIGPDLERKLRQFLFEEEPRTLKHDLTLASAKVNDYIVRIMKPPVTENDTMATINS